jgi:DNA polymerase-3 subunit alpha
MGLAGIAITDHETLSSHLRAIEYMKKKRKDGKCENFKLVLGNEIYLVRNGMTKANYDKMVDRFWHFILLAKDAIGHQQLRKISSAAWKKSYRQYIERVPTYYSDIEEAIGDKPGHLIGSTACLGSFFARLVMDSERADELKEFTSWCKKVFGEDFYIEIQPSHQRDQIEYNKVAVNYAKKHGFKVVFTTDSHYLTKEDRAIHKAFLNANEGEREVDAFYSATYMMPFEEICEYMNYFTLEQMEEMKINTLEILSKCEEYSLEAPQVVPKILYGKLLKVEEKPSKVFYPYINTFFNSEDIHDLHFIHKIMNKFDSLTTDKSAEWIADHLARIEEECEEIWLVSERIGEKLSAYFMTMAQIIDIAWNTSESIVGPGRGSSYVMLTCFLLGITQEDPLKSPVTLPSWRFLHREKIELPDIDTDFQATKKDRIIQDITNYFEKINGNVVRIATFGTETSKAAIQTASRGLGYESEIGTYLSSLVPVDRGQVRSLNECYSGNEEKDFKPVPQFVSEMNSYADIWKVAESIEGLISRRGIHAAGILITNDDFTNRNAFMKAPNGALTSQFELHDSEKMGCIKYDLLVTDALDRISVALSLLTLYGYIEWQGSLKATYDKYLLPGVLDYTSQDMWDMANTGKILSLFQFDTAVGGQAIRKIKPTTLLELAQANSLMRLMPEGRKETPVEEFIKYKEDITIFEEEIANLRGPKSQKDALLHNLLPLKGVADSQESLMLMVMDKNLTNFTVPEANFLRKTIAKKNTRDIDKLKDKFYEKGKENSIDIAILDYIWNVQVARQLGYSFSLPHTMAYSTIAVQEMNLAYRFPTIFWNTACLIVESAGIDENEMFFEEDIFETNEEEVPDEEEDNPNILEGILEPQKKKVKVVNYGKISSAIGKMIDAGVSISLPDINKSDFTFTPDVDENRILFGLKGISKINTEMAKDIIKFRPYSSLVDFTKKIKINKLPLVNLIKSGAFDNVEGLTREEIMDNYLETISDKKSKLTMANVPMLDKYKLIPPQFEFERRLFNYNRYLKKHKYQELYYEIDDIALEFYDTNFGGEHLVFNDGKRFILQKTWDKMYIDRTKKLKEFLKGEGGITCLARLNKVLVNEMVEKYAGGSLSKWEMDSVSFYSHPHEFIGVKNTKYDIRNFFDESENPIVEKVITVKGGVQVPLFELYRIAGTVIDKNKLKNTITISTQFGVVDVKIYKAQFSKYDKQLFEKQPDGTKKVIEKSWFARGNKVMITGIRRENNFVPKVYKTSQYLYPIQLISEIKENGLLEFKPMRDD